MLIKHISEISNKNCEVNKYFLTVYNFIVNLYSYIIIMPIEVLMDQVPF